MALACIVACQDGNVFACRSETRSAMSFPLFSNPWIWYGLVFDTILILAILFVPPLQSLFATTPLPLGPALCLLLCPPTMVALDELYKRILVSKRRSP